MFDRLSSSDSFVEPDLAVEVFRALVDSHMNLRSGMGEGFHVGARSELFEPSDSCDASIGFFRSTGEEKRGCSEKLEDFWWTLGWASWAHPDAAAAEQMRFLIPSLAAS